MLRISKLTDYGTIIMHYLSLQQEAMFSANTIAKATHIKQPTVSKLLKILQEAGLVTATRGANGGYKLSRDANRITVAEIITAIEGWPALTECSDNAADCAQQQLCELKNNWQIINRVIMAALQSLTLADMKKSLHSHPLVKHGVRFKDELGANLESKHA